MTELSAGDPASVVAPDPGRVPARLLLPRFIALDAALVWRRWRRRLGWLRLADSGIETLAPPDTQVVRDAFALAREVSPPFLFHHAARSWAFAATFAVCDRLAIDREALAVAAILHDLGLTEPLDREPGSFEWVGARAAHRFCLAHGMSSARADLVHDAIALHAAVGVAPGYGPEAALVHFGAGCDVLGLRLDEVSPGMLAKVLETWPRLGFKAAFPPLLDAQVRAKPDCHIVGHVALGFARRVKSAPFYD